VVRTPADGTAGAYIVVVRGAAGVYIVVARGTAGAYMVVAEGAAGAMVVAAPALALGQFVQVELNAYGVVCGGCGLPNCSDSHDAWLTVAATWITTSAATPIVIVCFHRYIIGQLPSCRR